MRKVALVTGVVVAAFFAATDLEAGRRGRCGGCSDPCAGGGCGQVTYYSTSSYSYASSSSSACPARQPIESGPVTGYKVVMVPTYVTETQSVCSHEYKDEERTRTYTVYKTVPVEEERVRTSVNWVRKTETKTVEYEVQVPVKEEKTVEFTRAVPVYEDVEEEYTVRVPVLKEVEEEYTAKVPVVTDVEFTYTVCVPSVETETRLRTVTNAVPVTKTKTVTHCVPTTRTRNVTKDYGHWVTQYVQVAAGCGYSRHGCGGCGSCGGCGGGGYYTTVCQRRWVPNVRTEQVVVSDVKHESHQVTYTVYEQRSEQIPVNCSYIVYKPETRTGTKKSVSYKNEVRTRTRPVVEYEEQTRTRTSKKLTYKEETQTETYPVVSYQTETKTKEISYTVKVPESNTETYTVTRHERVPEVKTETYTTRVAVPVVKLVDVQVCKLVPKLVETTEYPCASRAVSSYGCGHRGGCGGGCGHVSRGCCR